MNNIISNSQAKFGFFVCLVGMIVFSVLWIHGPREREIIREVEKRVPIEVVTTKFLTNVVEKPVQVEKIIEKRVEVPARIPEEYEIAMKFTRSFISAPYVSKDEEKMWNIESVNPKPFVNPQVGSVVSEDEIKTKFEITLRKYGVPINYDSPIWLRISVEGLWDDNRVTLTYTTGTALTESAQIFRNGDAKRLIVETWSSGSYGYAGRNVAREAILNAVEAKAESFANKYLAANPKK